MEFATISKDELRAKLEAGEKIEKVHIERLQLCKTEINYPIHIVDSQIDILDFNNSTFAEKIVVRRCQIDTLVLSEATFHKKCDFEKSRIKHGTAKRATFCDVANFSESKLASYSFHQCTFEKKANFSRAGFFPDATFTEATFKGEAHFNDSKIEGSGDFTKVKFEGRDQVEKYTETENGKEVTREKVKRANRFHRMEIGKDLKMRNCVVEGSMVLFESVVRLTIDLCYSRLEGHTDFSNVTAGRSLLLQGVKPGEKQGFRFHNASSNLILLDRETVEGHVFPENDGKYAQAAKEYGFLRTTFEEINRFDDEDWAYYQFKRMERMGTRFSWSPIPLIKRGIDYFFLDIGCGYGTKPFRTLLICFGFMLCFALCYFAAGVPVPATENFGVDSPTLNRFFYSINISLVAFSGSYGDLRITGPIKFLAMFEYMLGVVFIGMFIVVFSRKVIR